MRPKIIIVEGPDNCGKTTLAKSIAYRLNATYWHMTAGKGLVDHDAMALYQLNAIHNAIVNVEQGRTIVFDRLWPSDVVYGTALRGRPSTPVDQFIELLKPHAVYIFCMRANAIEEHAKNQDPDHPYDPSVYASIYDGYMRLLSKFEKEHPNVLTYWLDNFISNQKIDRSGQVNAFIYGLSNL